MAAQMIPVPEQLDAIAHGDRRVLETLAQMTVDTFPKSKLEREEYMLVRIAALVAMDAAPVSYLANIGEAVKQGLSLEKVQDTLVAIAPVIGTARTVSGAANMLRALGYAKMIKEREEYPGEMHA